MYKTLSYGQLVACVCNSLVNGEVESQSTDNIEYAGNSLASCLWWVSPPWWMLIGVALLSPCQDYGIAIGSCALYPKRSYKVVGSPFRYFFVAIVSPSMVLVVGGG